MDNYGQYFTPDWLVSDIVKLIKNTGKILEPACGDGAFLRQLPKDRTIGIEIDEKVIKEPCLCMDFFDFSEKVDTIIGNPPYVRGKEISQETKKKLKNSSNYINLYIHFIDRSIDLLVNGGELIFLVPRDFINLTCAEGINKRLFQEGGFTYWHEYGDLKIFKDACPNVVVFRWVKNERHKIDINYLNGRIYFSSKMGTMMSDLFSIKVGGASGANNIFFNENGNIDVVVSSTFTNGKTKKAFYCSQSNEYLSQYKDILMNRKIRKFDESNWWEWGRKIPIIDGEKIYVNMKTRKECPFFTNDSNYFDGSVLCLIPKSTSSFAVEDYIKLLNQNDWESQGFIVGGRYIFGQRSLLNAYLLER